MVTLTEAQMPNHTHALRAADRRADSGIAVGNTLSEPRDGNLYQTNTSANLVPMADQALPSTGGSQAHNNMQPYLTMNYIIALVGLYPSRS